MNEWMNVCEETSLEKAGESTRPWKEGVRCKKSWREGPKSPEAGRPCMTRGGGRRSSWWPTGHRGQTVPIGIWVSFAARRHRNPLFIKSSELCLSVDCVMRFFLSRNEGKFHALHHSWYLLKIDPPRSAQSSLSDPDKHIYPPGLWVTSMPVTLMPVLQVGFR